MERPERSNLLEKLVVPPESTTSELKRRNPRKDASKEEYPTSVSSCSLPLCRWRQTFDPPWHWVPSKLLENRLTLHSNESHSTAVQCATPRHARRCNHRYGEQVLADVNVALHDKEVVGIRRLL